MEEKRTNRKRVGLLAALAMCCVLAVGAGVMAWFSANDEVSNVFLSGDGITDPEVNPKPDPNPDPNKPIDPDPDPNNPVDPDPNKPHLSGNIIETEWQPNSAISAESSVAKNPNIGIGKTSKPAYVFAEVENGLGAGTYFILNPGWEAVNATNYDGTKGWAAIHANDPDKQGKAYTSGLFVYVGENPQGSDVTDRMALLESKTVTGKDGKWGAYTGELFSKVYAGNKAEITGINQDCKMDVKAFLAAASSDGEFTGASASEAKAEILAAAKAWTTSNNN